MSRERVTVPYQQGSLRICLVLILLTINDVVNLQSAGQRHVDDSTNYQFETDKIRAFEQELLNSTGLPDQPQTLTDHAILIEQSGFKFLLNIYESYVMKKPNEREPPEFDFTRDDVKVMDQSDAITTVMAHPSHQTAGGKLDKVATIWFDVVGVSAEDQVTMAQLRLYRVPYAKNRGAFNISVFQVLSIFDDKIETQFVDSAITEAGHKGWITINVTKALLHWTKHPGDKKGLYVSVHPICSLASNTKPEDIGIVLLESYAKRYQPFMAGFFKRNESDEASLIRPPSFTDYNKRHEQERHISDRKSSRSCRVRNFSISLKELQWKNWVIAPNRLELNYCSDEFNFPLSDKMSVTNHATRQTVLDLLDPKKMPKSCCAPTKLSAIHLLYYVNDDTATLRKLEDMSVQDCGCHRSV